jgi:23S rRNA pseudouridine1911/1915/1917 synthase
LSAAVATLRVMNRCTVPEESAGQRLDQFLRTQFPQLSRSFLQKLIAQGNVTLSGRLPQRDARVRTGDEITVEIPPPRPLKAHPEKIPLDVLYEDDDLIVINKPAGVIVHPAAGNVEHTLVNALLHHCRGELSGIGGVQRPGIVHRLDKDTTGCLVAAKSDFAHQRLVEEFRSRQVKKIYRAVCAGRFEKTSGRIETTIGRSTRNRKKMSARAPRGRQALTEYRVLKQRDDSAFVELALHTGRTHQIRVHMAHIGHPVVGDPVYGARSKIPVARPLLHAYKLGFVHPGTGHFVEFCAPMPEDFKPYE